MKCPSHATFGCKQNNTHTYIYTTEQERVEEDRFMRAQDEKWREKLREIRALEATDEEHRIHSEVISPVMQEVSSMLAATGDGNVSETGLERMAKWKLGLK